MTPQLLPQERHITGDSEHLPKEKSTVPTEEEEEEGENDVDDVDTDGKLEYIADGMLFGDNSPEGPFNGAPISIGLALPLPLPLPLLLPLR